MPSHFSSHPCCLTPSFTCSPVPHFPITLQHIYQPLSPEQRQVVNVALCLCFPASSMQPVTYISPCLPVPLTCPVTQNSWLLLSELAAFIRQHVLSCYQLVWCLFKTWNGLIVWPLAAFCHKPKPIHSQYCLRRVIKTLTLKLRWVQAWSHGLGCSATSVILHINTPTLKRALKQLKPGHWVADRPPPTWWNGPVSQAYIDWCTRSLSGGHCGLVVSCFGHAAGSGAAPEDACPLSSGTRSTGSAAEQECAPHQNIHHSGHHASVSWCHGGRCSIRPQMESLFRWSSLSLWLDCYSQPALSVGSIHALIGATSGLTSLACCSSSRDQPQQLSWMQNPLWHVNVSLDLAKVLGH